MFLQPFLRELSLHAAIGCIKGLQIAPAFSFKTKLFQLAPCMPQAATIGPAARLRVFFLLSPARILDGRAWLCSSELSYSCNAHYLHPSRVEYNSTASSARPIFHILGGGGALPLLKYVKNILTNPSYFFTFSRRVPPLGFCAKLAQIYRGGGLGRGACLPYLDQDLSKHQEVCFTP